MMSPALAEDTYREIKEKIRYIPGGYKTLRPVEVGTAPMIDPQFLFNEFGMYQQVPIWRLQEKTKKFYTPKPISVRFYQDEGLFFAENDNLLVYGSGDTPQKALRDLTLHIIHFFKYYRSCDKDKLRGEALRLKELYKNLLVEE